MMFKNKSFRVYLVMTICAITMLVLTVINLLTFNPKNLLIDALALILTLALIFEKYAKDHQLSKAVNIVNWTVLVLVFISIAAESNILFK